MNASQFERLQEQLSRLRLIKGRERLEAPCLASTRFAGGDVHFFRS